MHERAAQFAKRAESELGFEVDVHEFPHGTKTASDAADAIGCDVAQVAGSIAMMADDLVIVVTSGANRVNENRLAELRGVEPESISMADPSVVKERLGWSIGGVPPFLHDSTVPVYLDETLTDFDTIWAAAGTPDTVFPINPQTLRDLADAPVVSVTE